MTCLIERYPESVPATEYNPILSCLYQLLTTCKKTEASRWIINCLNAVAISASRTQLSDNVLSDIQQHWLNICPSIIR